MHCPFSKIPHAFQRENVVFGAGGHCGFCLSWGFRAFLVGWAGGIADARFRSRGFNAMSVLVRYGNVESTCLAGEGHGEMEMKIYRRERWKSVTPPGARSLLSPSCCPSWFPQPLTRPTLDSCHSILGSDMLVDVESTGKQWIVGSVCKHSAAPGSSSVPFRVSRVQLSSKHQESQTLELIAEGGVSSSHSNLSQEGRGYSLGCGLS